MIRIISILVWIFILCQSFHTLEFTSCKFEIESNCSPTEYCDRLSGKCSCLKGFERFNSTLCIPSSKTDEHTTPKHSSLVEHEDGGSITAYILTPLFLIIFVICGIYINRKYHLVTWVKKKIHRKNENYDEFMIGQDLDDDDPPLH